MKKKYYTDCPIISKCHSEVHNSYLTFHNQTSTYGLNLTTNLISL